MEKQAFEFNLPVSTIVSAITGAEVANKVMQNKVLEQQKANDNTIVLSGDYYSQVENMANNMKVTFTPFGVVYSLKNGGTWAQFETIATESMNRSMYMAWQDRNEMYFKNLILNKVKSEIQFAEQQFARNIINKHLEMGKQASYDILPTELFNYVENLSTVYQRPGMDKVASIMFSEYDDEIIKIAMSVENPHGFSDTVGGSLDFMKINNKNNLEFLQRQMLSPRHLSSHGKVAFLPDRVLFVVDNMVLTSLLAFDMDAEGFDAFEKKDENFFKNYFDRESRIGLKRMESMLSEKKKITKEAGVITVDVKDIFTNNFVHPAIYYKVLGMKYGATWFEYDTTALVKIIETDFGLEDPITDIPLNKILAIQCINASEAPYSNVLVFEKIVRSFSSLDVDWSSEQNEDMPLEDIAFGIECFDMLTPEIDTYEEFSEEVFSFLVTIMEKSDVKVFLPEISLRHSKDHETFYTVLNEYLLNAQERRATDGITDLDIKSGIIQKEDLLQNAIKNTLDSVKKNIIKVESEAINVSLGSGNCPLDLIPLGISQVINCMKIDYFLTQQKNMLEGQLYVYNLGEKV